MGKKSKVVVIPSVVVLLCIFITYLPSMVLLFYSNSKNATEFHPDIVEDLRLRMPELVTKHGYNAEVHHVTTEDGYILQIHRIKSGPKSTPEKKKGVCFMMHGLTTSSVSFVLSGPNHALAYRLVDEGWDVWMGNARGNMYSNKHKILKPFGSQKDQRKFWRFSWHEVGVLDLPASIDYVLKETGAKKLQYIGHSQGTTSFFVMAAEIPEYNDKIEAMHALGPTAFLSKSKSGPLVGAARYINSLKQVMSFLGIHYLYPSITATKFCQDERIAKQYCEDMIETIMGISDQMNATLSPLIFEQVPAGAAVDQFVHYSQLINSGRFQQFDHGEVENLKLYNRSTPPDYNLSNIKAPVALYYAESDAVTVIYDVERLWKELPNVINKYKVPHDRFNHADFIWGLDAPRIVYDELLRTMESIRNSDES